MVELFIAKFLQPCNEAGGSDSCSVRWRKRWEKGRTHETENEVRLGLPRIIGLKENAPELDYSSFYEET